VKGADICLPPFTEKPAAVYNAKCHTDQH